MPFAEDLSLFFNEDEFAEPATLDSVAVTGILENDYAAVFGMATREPMFTLAATDAASATQGSLLVVPASSINAGTYRVRIAQFDGTGLCRLLLEKQ